MTQTLADSGIPSPLGGLDVRTIAFSSALDAAMPAGAHAQLLLSGDSRYDCLFLAQHIEPGASGPARHKHKVDQYYIVLSGIMTIDLAGIEHDVPAGTLIVVPAGMGHTTFNRHPQSEYHVELFVPDQPLTLLSTPSEPGDGSGLDARFVSLSAGERFASKDAAFRILAIGSAGEAIDARGNDLVLIALNGGIEIDDDEGSARLDPYAMVAMPAGSAASVRATAPETTTHLLRITLTKPHVR